MADPYNLKKRGKYWVPDFTLYGTRIHKSTKCGMKADAEKRCREWAQAIIDRNDGKPPKPKVLTLKEILDAWDTANRGVLSDKHVDGTLDKIRLHFGELMDLEADQLTTDRIEDVRTAYLKNPGPTGRMHTAGGANSLIMALNTVMGWAVETNRLPARPFRLRRVPKKRKPRRVVPLADTNSFLAAVDAPYKPSAHPNSPKAKPKNPHVLLAIRLMLGLGLREREALAARWEWVDWHNRTYYAGETKNGDVRLIPIPKWLLAYLKKTKQDEGLILPGEDDQPHAGQFTKKVLNQVSRDLSLPGLTPHRLRATFATNHARAGTPLKTIQVWLGHEKIETTEIYIEFVDQDGLAAQEKVAAMMGFGDQKPKKQSPKKHPKSL